MEQAVILARLTLRGYAAWGMIFLVLTLIERVFAKEQMPWGRRLKGLAFWVIWIPGSLLITTGLLALWHAIGVKPFLSVDMVRALGWAGPFATAGAILLGVLVSDFFAYWFHRIQHRFLWRFHAVHHSITDMSAVNSYHHISEAFFNTLITTIPLSLISIDYGPTLTVVGILTWYQAVFLHSPATLNFGVFRAIVADNRYHRIHHSLERHHFDRNFAITFSFWDRLFGTAHVPAKEEWPAVGLVQIEQPATILDWLDLPLRYREPGVAIAPEPPANVNQLMLS